MEQCPKCGNYMKFHMTYNCGVPFIYYACECGYDTTYEQTFATSQITYDFTLIK